MSRPLTIKAINAISHNDAQLSKVDHVSVNTDVYAAFFLPATESHEAKFVEFGRLNPAAQAASFGAKGKQKAAVWDGMYAKLKLSPLKHWNPSINLTIKPTWTKPNVSSKAEQGTQFIAMFTPNNLVGFPEAEHIPQDASAETIAHVVAFSGITEQKLRDLQAVSNNLHVFRFQYSRSKFLGTNLQTTFTQYESEAATMAALKDILAADTLYSSQTMPVNVSLFLVGNPDNFEPMVETFLTSLEKPAGADAFMQDAATGYQYDDDLPGEDDNNAAGATAVRQLIPGHYHVSKMWPGGIVNPQTGMSFSEGVLDSKDEMSQKVWLSRGNFETADEFFTVVHYTLQQEKAHADRKKDVQVPIILRMYRIPTGTDKRYVATVYIPELPIDANDKVIQIRLSRGDKGNILFDTTTEGNFDFFFMVLDQPTWVPGGQTLIALNRKFHSDEKNPFWDPLEIPPTQILDIDAQRDTLVQHDFAITNRGLSATLIKHESSEPPSKAIAAMKVAHNEYKRNNANIVATVNTILGNEPNRVPGAPFMGHLLHPTNDAHNVTVVSAINNIFRAEVKASQPNHDQFEALKVMVSTTHSLPGRIIIINGPAGVGKSTTVHIWLKIAEQLRAFNPALETTIMYVATSAFYLDESVNKIGRMLMKLHGVDDIDHPKMPIMARIISKDTDKAIAWREPSNQRYAAIQANLTEEARNLMAIWETANAESAAGPQPAHDLLELVKLACIQKFEGIRDKRVKELTTAFGTRILQFIGYLRVVDPANPTGPLVLHRIANPDATTRFASLRDYLDRFSEGGVIDSDEKGQVSQLFLIASRETLAKCTMVFATPFQLLQERIFQGSIDGRGFSPQVIINEEASTMSAADVYPVQLLFNKAKPASMLFVGDLHQKTAFSAIDKRDRRFPCMLNPMARFMYCGYEIFESTLMRRCGPQTTNLLAYMVYADLQMLSVAAPTPDDDRTNRIMQRLSGNPNLVTDVLWIEKDAMTEKSPSSSKYNIPQACHAFYVAQVHFEEGVKPEDLMLISPYIAHNELVRKVIPTFVTHLRSTENPLLVEAAEYIANHGLLVVTIDDISGHERDRVILSWVATNTFGFTDELHRSVSAFSRAKESTVVLGSLRQLKEGYSESQHNVPFDKKPLAKAGMYLKNKGYFSDWDALMQNEEPAINDDDDKPPSDESGVNDETSSVDESGVNDETPPADESGVNDETPPADESGVNDETPPVDEPDVNDETLPADESDVNDETPPVDEPEPDEDYSEYLDTRRTIQAINKYLIASRNRNVQASTQAPIVLRYNPEQTQVQQRGAEVVEQPAPDYQFETPDNVAQGQTPTNENSDGWGAPAPADCGTADGPNGWS